MTKSITSGFVCFLVLVFVFQESSTLLAQPGEIKRWKQQDAIDAPPAGAILFTGSSSIRRWEQLTRDFADYNIIQRGWGGSQLSELNDHVNDIVLSCHPAAVVVWEGTNDLTYSTINGAAKTAAMVVDDFKRFVNLVHTPQPDVEIFFLGITATPERPNNPDKNIAVNAAIEEFCTNNPRLHYVDLPAAFNSLNPPDGPDFNNKYVDPVHLNRDGYDLWSSIIRPELESVIAPNKVFEMNPKTPVVGVEMFFDFGPSDTTHGDPTHGVDANGNQWNNWYPIEIAVQINSGEHLGDLIDSKGNATGILLTITGGFEATGKILAGGLLAPQANLLGDLAVASATEDYFFSGADGKIGGGNDDRPGGIMLSGLNPKLIYDFRFFGSRNGSNQIQRTEYLVYGINSGADSLITSGPKIGADHEYDGNDNQFAEVLGIGPDRFGQIFIDVNLLKGEFAYLNAMKIAVSGNAVEEPKVSD